MEGMDFSVEMKGGKDKENKTHRETFEGKEKAMAS